VQANQQILNGVVSFLYSSNYLDMFLQVTANFRGLHVSRKLLQVCLRLRWMWIRARSVGPATPSEPLFVYLLHAHQWCSIYTPFIVFNIHTIYCVQYTHHLLCSVYTPFIVFNIHTIYCVQYTHHLLCSIYTPFIVFNIHTTYCVQYTHHLLCSIYTPFIVFNIHTICCVQYTHHLLCSIYTPFIVFLISVYNKPTNAPF
jgi:branched-subunit amino acid transport protein